MQCQIRKIAVSFFELTSEIVAAHVSNNTLAVNDLPQLIQDVYTTLATVERGKPHPSGFSRQYL